MTAPPSRSPWWANVPNLITLARICAVPLIVWLLMRQQDEAAFWLFVAAGVSDALDGFIAKRFGAETLIGGFLDPIADKALLVSVYVTLGMAGALPVWLVILVVFRDVLIVAGALLFETVTHALTMAPLPISKLNTVAQIVLAALAMGDRAFDLTLTQETTIMTYAVGVTTFLSGAGYVFVWVRRFDAVDRGGRR